MTETFLVAGRKLLPGLHAGAGDRLGGERPGGERPGGERPGAGRSGGEAGRIDRLIDLVLMLEPLELKQHGTADLGGAVPAAAAGSAAAPTLVTESTQRMLMQMRAVLDREAARLGADGAEGKAAVDQVALIARTLEKIDQMERLIAEDQARAMQQTLSAEEREQLRQTVRQLILAAAERLAVERAAEKVNQGESRASTGGPETVADESEGQEISDRGEAETV